MVLSEMEQGVVNGFPCGADSDPVKPLVPSVGLEVGNLATDRVFEAHGTAGVLFERLAFFGGYDYLRIGPVELQGALAGLQLWF